VGFPQEGNPMQIVRERRISLDCFQEMVTSNVEDCSVTIAEEASTIKCVFDLCYVNLEHLNTDFFRFKLHSAISQIVHHHDNGQTQATALFSHENPLEFVFIHLNSMVGGLDFSMDECEAFLAHLSRLCSDMNSPSLLEDYIICLRKLDLMNPSYGEDLRNVFQKFITAANEAVAKILEEIETSQESSTKVSIGGLAGGEKFIVSG
jgi:hypothetical protein